MTDLQQAEEHLTDTLDAIVEEEERREKEDLPGREDLKNLRSKLASALNDVRDIRQGRGRPACNSHSCS